MINPTDALLDPTAFETSLLPPPVPGEGFRRQIRWFLSWVRVIAFSHGVRPRKFGRLAERLRAGTIALTFVGLAFGVFTPKGVRITPLFVQLLIVVAIWIFASVGIWMLCWPESRTGLIGWTFCSAASIGAVIFVAASYANLAIEGRDLPGGVVAGWAADLLFLPSIAVLLPL